MVEIDKNAAMMSYCFEICVHEQFFDLSSLEIVATTTALPETVNLKLLNAYQQ